MADPYRRYSSIENDPRAAVPGSIPSNAPSTASHPGYIPSNAPSTASHQMWRMSDSRGTPDFLRNDVLPLRSGGYGLDDHAAMGSYAATKLDGLATGDSIRAFSPLEDPALARRDVPVGIKHDIMTDGLLSEESNILFVDNLPTDCTRREVAHLFRPFIGFKEIRVVHKEPRRTGDKAKVLCFVEFDNAKCALTALEALQGYKFDDKKPDAPVLRIQLVKFPFRPTSLRNDQR